MWSNIYDYYELRLTLAYETTVGTNRINAVLANQAELKRKGLLIFHNATGYPWIDLCVVNSKNGNFCCNKDTWVDNCNLIPIVCAKAENGQIPVEQLTFLLKLARLLNWYLIQEENESEEENVILWSPE